MPKKEYGFKRLAGAKPFTAPALPYEPPRPKKYNPPIGLIGCGGISAFHLAAYRKMKLNIVALCDANSERAQARAKEFFPRAGIYTNPKQLLSRDDIEVVDIATHARDREYLIPLALRAGKHVLSQKPFVERLDVGQRFVDLAEKQGVKLAVNQNGRWAPHFSYVRHAVAKGIIGDVSAVRLAVHWDHEWITGTSFNSMHHVLLFDFAIHWFDMVHCLLAGKKPGRVFAMLDRCRHQSATPPLLGEVVMEFDGAQASLIFDGATKFGHLDHSAVIGSKGTLISSGPDLQHQAVVLHTGKGTASPSLEGCWFAEGFMGTMGELLCAIESKREPSNSGADVLQSLELCFAAVRSAETGRPVVSGKVRQVPLEKCRPSQGTV